MQLHQTDQADRLVQALAAARKAEILAFGHAHDPHREHRIALHHLDEIFDRGLVVQQQPSNRDVNLGHGHLLGKVADELACSIHR